jgi:hypothetical protein
LDAESLASTVNELVPVPVGVPEITPADESVRPDGREPLYSDQVYGDVPPVARSCLLYAVPSTASDRLVVEIVKAGDDALPVNAVLYAVTEFG